MSQRCDVDLGFKNRSPRRPFDRLRDVRIADVFENNEVKPKVNAKPKTSPADDLGFDESQLQEEWIDSQPEEDRSGAKKKVQDYRASQVKKPEPKPAAPAAPKAGANSKLTPAEKSRGSELFNKLQRDKGLSDNEGAEYERLRGKLKSPSENRYANVPKPKAKTPAKSYSDDIPWRPEGAVARAKNDGKGNPINKAMLDIVGARQADAARKDAGGKWIDSKDKKWGDAQGYWEYPGGKKATRFDPPPSANEG